MVAGCVLGGAGQVSTVRGQASTVGEFLDGVEEALVLVLHLCLLRYRGSRHLLDGVCECVRERERERVCVCARDCA